jgi:thiamine biosynthesis lipoprotein
MGTVLEVTVVANDELEARRLASEAFVIGRHWDDVLSTWRPDAELARFNAQSRGDVVPVSPSLHGALARMLALHAATAGAFDPAVGANVMTLRRGGAPAQAAAVPLGRALTLMPGAARLAEGVALDAGAIGKGIALDDIAAHLRRGDARAWFLDFGGSSQLAYSDPEGTHRWSVALAGLAPGVIHGMLDVSDGSLSTSRTIASDDPAGAIVDPSTGAPVAGPRLATVAASDATTADAWSTAIIVLGRRGVERAQAAGLEVLYEDAQGVTATPGMRKRRPQP